MSVTLLIIAAVFVIAWFLVKKFPETTQRWFKRLIVWRMVIFGIFWLAFGTVLIGTGVSYLMVVGVLIWFAFALFVLLEDPQQEVKSWIGV